MIRTFPTEPGWVAIYSGPSDSTHKIPVVAWNDDPGRALVFDMHGDLKPASEVTHLYGPGAVRFMCVRWEPGSADARWKELDMQVRTINREGSY